MGESEVLVFFQIQSQRTELQKIPIE